MSSEERKGEPTGNTMHHMQIASSPGIRANRLTIICAASKSRSAELVPGVPCMLWNPGWSSCNLTGFQLTCSIKNPHMQHVYMCLQQQSSSTRM